MVKCDKSKTPVLFRKYYPYRIEKITIDRLISGTITVGKKTFGKKGLGFLDFREKVYSGKTGWVPFLANLLYILFLN